MSAAGTQPYRDGAAMLGALSVAAACRPIDARSRRRRSQGRRRRSRSDGRPPGSSSSTSSGLEARGLPIGQLPRRRHRAGRPGPLPPGGGRTCSAKALDTDIYVALARDLGPPIRTHLLTTTLQGEAGLPENLQGPAAARTLGARQHLGSFRLPVRVVPRSSVSEPSMWCRVHPPDRLSGHRPASAPAPSTCCPRTRTRRAKSSPDPDRIPGADRAVRAAVRPRSRS